MSDQGRHVDLAACQEAVERLAGEVTLLREASTTFADLAERLNRQLMILRGQLGQRAPGRDSGSDASGLLRGG